MVSVVAFDVNETLLDLGALDAPFQELLGSAALRPQWFALMLQLSFTGGLTGQYVDFTAAQRAALVMLAERQGVPLASDDIDDLVGRMSSLPPHPEVPGALAALARTSLRMVALTNSLQPVAEAQLTGAGLRGYFEAVISADSTRHLKPAPQPYQAVAEHCGVGIGQVRLVAAHSWDITGALGRWLSGSFCCPSRNGPQPPRQAAHHRRVRHVGGHRPDHRHRRVNAPLRQRGPVSVIYLHSASNSC